MTEKEMTNWIDTASFDELLYKHRFEPSNSPWFQPPIADYFSDEYLKRIREMGQPSFTAASKRVGWNK